MRRTLVFSCFLALGLLFAGCLQPACPNAPQLSCPPECSLAYSFDERGCATGAACNCPPVTPTPFVSSPTPAVQPPVPTPVLTPLPTLVAATPAPTPAATPWPTFRGLASTPTPTPRPPELGAVCGNGVCEQGEGYGFRWKDGCPADCADACRSPHCNDKAQVYCICPYYENFSRMFGCVARAGPCADCSELEPLFDDFLEIQTQVFDCLSEYFGFRPPRLNYGVFRRYSEEACGIPIGCTTEGGPVGASVWVSHNLQGTRPFGENHPTLPGHLLADKHETTHLFLAYALHLIPSWFNEAVAIQTNERLYCHPQERPGGDGYLQERPGDYGGVTNPAGVVIDEGVYFRLKRGEVAASALGLGSHDRGTLFIIGLRVDYNCTKDCVRDIVRALYEYERRGCSLATPRCSSQQDAVGAFPQSINASVIKQKTSEVVGRDVTPLFETLGITDYS
ncbi:MAG: hypothetical protein AB1626_00305 [Candidatus Micrarchaeota archaeon]